MAITKSLKDFIASVKARPKVSRFGSAEASEQVVKIRFPMTGRLGWAGNLAAGLYQKIPNVVMIVACRLRQDDFDRKDCPWLAQNHSASRCCCRPTFTGRRRATVKGHRESDWPVRSLKSLRRTIRWSYPRCVATGARRRLRHAADRTAGRLHIDDELMEERSRIKSETHPVEILFVADAMTGQDAVRSAEEFHRRIGITGWC